MAADSWGPAMGSPAAEGMAKKTVALKVCRGHRPECVPVETARWVALGLPLEPWEQPGVSFPTWEGEGVLRTPGPDPQPQSEKN